jgi:hypothetical protein
MSNDELWQAFIHHCAADLLKGQLTTGYLKEAAKHPRVYYSAASDDFRACVSRACEEISPSSTRQRSLELEIEAAERRFKQLLHENKQFHAGEQGEVVST